MDMYIETPRMFIRKFIPEDADDLYDILGDAETMENVNRHMILRKRRNF